MFKQKLLLIFLLGIAASCSITKNKPQVQLTEKINLEVTTDFINGSKEKIIGNYDKAIISFKNCLKNNPDHAASYYELSLISSILKKDTEALEFIEKAVKIEPANKWYYKAYADILISNKKYKEAADIYRLMDTKFPFDSENYFNWAMCNIYLSKFNDAIDVYNKIEAIIGVTEEISIQKQKLYIQLKKPVKAIEEIQRLVDENPKDTEYLIYLADLYLDNNMSDKALGTYKRILEIDSLNGAVHLSMADYYRKQKNYEESFSELRKAFQSKQLDVDVKIKILLSYYTLTENSTELKGQADTLLQILTEVESQEPKVFAMYADFLYRDRKLNEAETQLLRVLSLDSSKYAIWEQLLYIQSESNKTEALKKYSLSAIGLFPEQPVLYLFNGMANYILKEYPEAIRILNKGIALVVYDNEMLVKFYIYLGESYYSNKNYSEAYSIFDKILQVDSKNVYILNNYSYYLALQGKDLDKAEKMGKKLVELSPDEDSYLDTYGWVLYKQGKLDEAEKQIAKAIEKGGDKNAVILEHYGDVLYKSGQKDKALEYWKKAQSTGNGSDLLDKKISDNFLYE